MVFSLFPRKSASALLFRETVQTQYLNKRRGAQKSVPQKYFFSPQSSNFCQFVWARPNGSNVHGSKLPGQSRKVPGRIEASKQVKTNMDEPERCVMQTGLEQTCVAPSTRGWWARGAKNPCAGGGFCCSVCVCVWGGAGCWEGKAHVGKRGIAWRGANGARAVGGPPPRVVTACGRGGLWLSLPLRRVPCSRGSLTRVCVFAPQT